MLGGWCFRWVWVRRVMRGMVILRLMIREGRGEVVIMGKNVWWWNGIRRMGWGRGRGRGLRSSF